MKRITILLVFVSLLFTSCMKNHAPVPGNVTTDTNQGVFVVNEGNFTYGNSSLTYYDPGDDSVYNNVFFNTNGLPLGDVAVSMTIQDSLGYVVVNNSGKIYVINVNNFQYVGKITGLVSPRRIYFVSATKAYVTDLYSKALFVVNPETDSVTGQISLDNHNTQFSQHNSEQIVFYGNDAFVNSWSYDDKVMVIDTHTDRVVDSITVAKQPNSMVLDKNNKLWVLSDGGWSGSPYGQAMPALTRINPVTRQVEKVFQFNDMDASPDHLSLNAAGDSLFYLYRSYSAGSLIDAGVYGMSVSANSLPTLPIVPENSHTFYGLGIDPHNSRIYVTDALDYQQNGTVLIYSPSGVLSDSITAGIIPGSFCFK
ncbi:MAG: YncE family protein [Bacteroidales bacterium]|nr:YncE family protein [Bacteroidales bacterium]